MCGGQIYSELVDIGSVQQKRLPIPDYELAVILLNTHFLSLRTKGQKV
jgi:hypothetical protein